MLGSWSLGDYGGPQSLRWGLELLCDHFGLKPEMLHATAFGGDDQVGPDLAALSTWSELGLPVEPLSAADNWWSNGPTGPCGPDSEIFIWTGTGPPQDTPGTDPRWLELWNHVTMRYYRHPDGSLSPLAAAERRHRHGPGTTADGVAGGEVGVRDGPVRAVAVANWPGCGTRTSAHCGSSPTTCGPRS